MATFQQRIDQHDREIAAIRKLIHTGMKMLVKSEDEMGELRNSIRELRTSIGELRASQRETDRQLQAFIRSMRRGANGHSKRTDVE